MTRPPLLPVLRGPLAGRYLSDAGHGIRLDVPTSPSTRYTLRTFPAADGSRWGYYWWPETDDPATLTLAEVDQLTGYVARVGREVPEGETVLAAARSRALLSRAVELALQDAAVRS